MSQQIKIALVMAMSLFMEILDGTIVTTALPKMATTFSTSMSQISLLISAYLVTVAIFIPMSGWLANYFGKKKIWLLAVFLFTISSLGSALAPSFGVLLGMRMLQGFSGALMTPTARLIVFEKTPVDQLLKMTSYLVWPALIAPAIAPIMGGAIITYLSWHWIFLINLPIGMSILILGYSLIPSDHDLIKNKFDWLGFVEMEMASTLLVVGAELSSRDGLSFEIAGIVCIVSGIIFLLFTYQHLNKVEQPLFSLKALSKTSFRIGQTSGAILWLSVGAMPYLLTIYLQNIFHWSAIVAGSYVIFIFIGNIGIKPFTTSIIRSLNYKGALIASFLMILSSSFCLFFIEATTFPAIIMLLAFASGIGRSLALTAFMGLSLSEIPPQERNSANTLNTVVQSLAQGLGVSFITLVIHLLEIQLSIPLAYSLSFAVLGALMLLPIIEILKIPQTMGIATMKK
ncbi:MFS transporter [Enterococcus hirae]|uniref:MFS transporter n=1 Tax=Enterococcus hirae TaxID=1354 RepID=UPI0009C1073B|nr:MFS transporter [Enterococcus hirae]EMF0307110.1 MFS transporter [Enterococcus hirae]EMF0456307.1 MFS transporter [Enterococcus hirae]OQO34325.1 MFS transporter [Enterococcus hirae]OQO37923.1 MFS transporter [Enterococcus hirae]OQO50246.1 MFS transporter [Enterococcus hirae]